MNIWLAVSVIFNVVLILAMIAQRRVIDNLSINVKRLCGEIANQRYAGVRRPQQANDVEEK
jgi:hypothetical protein